MSIFSDLTSMASNFMTADATREAGNLASDAQGRSLQQLGQSYGAQQAYLDPYLQSSNAGLARLNYALYGQTPQATTISPESWAAKNYLAANPNAKGATLYQDPMTGQVTTTAPQFNQTNMGVQGNSLNPMTKFTTQDWQNSPVASAYQTAQDAATKNLMDSSQAQWLAGGNIGGTQLNALSQNLGQLYAQYQPQSEAAAYNQWNTQRNQALNTLGAGVNSTIANQLGNYAGNYASNYGNIQNNLGTIAANSVMGQSQAYGQAAMDGGNMLQSLYGAGMFGTPNAKLV